jgi:predicted RNA-binding protein (virulence factor B family)
MRASYLAEDELRGRMVIGRTQKLPVWVIDDHGVLLGDRHGHAVLPAAEAPPGLKKRDLVEVFVYTDGEGHPTATRRPVAAQLHELVVLDVVATNAHGAFFRWGPPKDLFVPWSHQHRRLQEGDRAVVFIDLDEDTGRLVGHTKLIEILTQDTSSLRVGDPVDGLVYGHNDLGALVVVEDRYPGLLYNDRGRYRVGERLQVWVERVREDGKLDLSPAPVGRAGSEHGVEVVLEALERGGGFLPLTDNSPPELIQRRLGLSKKVFKKAVGALYRQRRVTLEDDGIRAVP